MRQSGGFSLIELLIVVAIILIIAAIAIPSLLRSKLAANESSAVSSLRTLNTAMASYNTAYPEVGYPDTLAKLAPPSGSAMVSSAAAGLVDPNLGCATQPCAKSGYLFSLTGTAGTPVISYVLNAVPGVVGQTGSRGFCTDQTFKITVDPGGGTSCTKDLQ